MYLEPPLSKTELAAVVTELIDRNGRGAGGIRFVLTGGCPEDGYSPGRPNLIGTVSPATNPHPSLYERGCSVYLHPYERQLPEVKTIDYIEGIRVQRTLRELGADYALYVDRDGNVRESDRSNYLIVRDGRLVTPGDSILHGITRRHLLRLAGGLDIPTSYAPVHANDLVKADEAIICSSTKGPLPITSVLSTAKGTFKKYTLGNGAGDITRRLMEAWPRYVKEVGQARSVFSN